MCRRIIPYIGIILTFLVTVETHAKNVTLKCSRGYSVTVTFTLRYPMQEPPLDRVTMTLMCPPDAMIMVPDGYDGIQADWQMTGPDGMVTNGTIPAADGTPPNVDDGFAPWGNNPLSPGKYICTATTCTPDPLAPPFIQAGELLLGEFDDGTSHQLTVTVLDADTRSSIAGASVIALNAAVDTSGATGTVVATGTSDADGNTTLDLDTGGIYQIKVESTGHLPQVSDEFQFLGDHTWTMLMTSGVFSNLLGDLDNDRDVDFQDFLIFVRQFGMQLP